MKLLSQEKKKKSIVVRNVIDSVVDTANYLVLCPVWGRTEKVLLGLYPGGIESIWHKENGDMMYMIHSINIDHQPSFLALKYEKKTHTVSKATFDQVRDFYKTIKESLATYATFKPDEE